MSTDTIDIKPFLRQAEREIRDRPAWRLINTGAALGAIGVLALIYICASTDPGDGTTLREAKPFSVIVAVLGGAAVIAGIRSLIDQRYQDKSREKSKRDFTKILTEMVIGHLRREDRRRADDEQRFDRIEDRIGRFEGTAAQLATEAVERQIPAIVTAVRRVMAEERKAAVSEMSAQIQEIKEHQIDLERDVAALIMERRSNDRGSRNGTVVPIRQVHRDEIQ